MGSYNDSPVGDDMFTVKELKLIASLIDNTPISGTIQTLPSALHEIVSVRRKVQEAIEAIEVQPEQKES